MRTCDYNTIGNIIQKSDKGAYLYEETGYANPHAVTDIASTTVEYDSNGNVTNYGSWTYGWDYRDRLATSTSGTATTTYGYDENGQRVKRTVDGTTTVYPNKYHTVEGATTTNHVFLPDGTLIMDWEIQTSTFSG